MKDRMGIQAFLKTDNVKTCSACGEPCTDDPEEQYECREVVFKDSKLVICSDCSINYEENDKGEVLLRDSEQGDENMRSMVSRPYDGSTIVVDDWEDK